METPASHTPVNGFVRPRGDGAQATLLQTMLLGKGAKPKTAGFWFGSGVSNR